MSAANLPRRAFLGQLARLPLIGGAVQLVGAPSASAAPVTIDLVENYKTWLQIELRALVFEMAESPVHASRYGWPHRDKIAVRQAMDACIWQNNPASHSFRHDGNEAIPRAALVLSAVGVDWTDRPPFHAWGAKP